MFALEGLLKEKYQNKLNWFFIVGN
jgi:hypothetical protein